MAIPTSATAFCDDNIQKITECKQKLRELGIAATVNLPRLVAAGDQSTGKSSLIEALSGIQVPRAAKRCTQTPIEIHISGATSDGKWECTVNVERQYFYDVTIDPNPTRTRPFGRWQPQKHSTTHKIATTKEPENVGGLIRIAQTAILNPEKDIGEYLTHALQSVNDGSDEDTSVTFSPNPVRIDISMSGWPSLSFTDLPGVFSSAENPDDRHYIQLVDNLLDHYARDPSTIILLTLPMTSDLVNSKSRDILHRVQSNIRAIDRTVAIMTKPDLAQPRALQQYLDKLNASAHRHEFGYGYRAVCMSDDAGHAEARQFEIDFFKKGRWADLSTKEQEQLGVDALRIYLQEILFAKTQKALPQALVPIDARVKSIDARLKAIFPPPDMAELTYIFDEIYQRFSARVKEKFCNGDSVIQKWEARSREFCTEILAQQPSFVMRSTSDGTWKDHMKLDDDRFMMSLDNIPNNLEGQDAMKEVCSTLMGIAIKKGWNRPFAELQVATERLIFGNVIQSAEEVLKRFKHFDVYKLAVDSLRKCVSDIIEGEFAYAEKMLDHEKASYWLADPNLFKKKLKIAQRQYDAERLEVRLEALQEWIDDPATKSGRVKVAREDRLDADKLLKKVEIAANVDAYYGIAAFRFTEGVCLAMRASLFEKLAQKLDKELKTFLALDADSEDQAAKFQAYMKEDPEVTREREGLLDEKKKLKLGRQYIIETLTDSTDTANGNEASSSYNAPNAEEAPPKAQYATAAQNNSTSPATPSPNKRTRDPYSLSSRDNTPLSTNKKQRLDPIPRPTLSLDTPVKTEDGSFVTTETDSPMKKLTLQKSDVFRPSKSGELWGREYEFIISSDEDDNFVTNK